MNLRTISDEDWFLQCAMCDAVDCDGFSVAAFRTSLAKHGLTICKVEAETNLLTSPTVTLMHCEACDGHGGYEEEESDEYPFGRSVECPHCNGSGYLVLEGETDTEPGAVQ